MTAQKSSKKSQIGAGMVEYLLILVMTVAIISALGTGLAQPLKDYFQVNVIGIVGCMLRVGQFPSTAFGLCQAAADTKIDVSGAFGSSSKGEGGSSSSGANSGSKSNSKGSSSGKNSSSDDKGGNSSRPKFVSSQRRGGSINESSGDSQEEGSKSIKISNGDVSSSELSFGRGGFKNAKGNSVSTRRIKDGQGIGGSFSVSSGEKEDIKNRIASSFTTKTKALPVGMLEEPTTESSFSILNKKKRDLSSTRKTTALEFSFFGMIKWGLIIAILAMVIFFTFSQLNSIRKGMD